MSWLRVPRLFLLIGGIGLLMLVAAVSTGSAGVIWLLVGLAGSALISLVAPRFQDPSNSQPGEEEPVGPVEAEPAPAEVEPAPDWGEPIALLPAPRSEADAEAGEGVPARRRHRRIRPRFRPTRIRLLRRRKEAAEPVGPEAPPQPVAVVQSAEVVVAQATTYQRGRPPVVRRIRLRFRRVSVQWKKAPPGEV